MTEKASAAKYRYEAQVGIIGAGPVGLTIANYLTMQGVSVAIFEQLDHLIDYPRAIGIDDEAFRTIQAIGLIDEVLPNTFNHTQMRLVTARGRIYADIKPRIEDFGWARRNTFNQPEVDRILYEGLTRRQGAEIVFSRTMTSFTQDERGVEIVLKDPEGREEKARVAYMVAADGGASSTRRMLKIGYEGSTAPNKWVVVDLRNDPLGTPHTALVSDPVRPYVSAGLPHGIRRFEFMVMSDETEEEIARPENLSRLLSKVMPHPEKIDLIRVRVYNHNQRLASRFRDRRIFLAGDAAHIMPVWQGQGYNSGMRDAFNLAWKLAMVVQGQCGEQVLDTYESERRDHAKAMIDLSVATGRIMMPPNAFLTWVRDVVTWVLNYIPPVRDYFLQGRFKPMPMYHEGILVSDPHASPRTSQVGRIFPQPRVRLEDGGVTLLDDVIGPHFAVLAWNTNPFWGLSAEVASRWKAIGTRFIQVVPEGMLSDRRFAIEGVTRVGDIGDRLRTWFALTPCGVVVVRPDRFVAAQALPQTAGQALERLAQVMRLRA